MAITESFLQIPFEEPSEEMKRLFGNPAGCHFKIERRAPCPPPAKGHLEFVESSPFFADNDLGDGAIVRIQHEGGEHWARLTWVDWNRFEWEQAI